MQPIKLEQNHIVEGLFFPEPVKIIALVAMGDLVKFIGNGIHSQKVHRPVLKTEQITQLSISLDEEPIDSDPAEFRPGFEAIWRGVAYKSDPWESLPYSPQTIRLQRRRRNDSRFSHMHI